MTEDEKAAAAHLTGTQKDEVTAFYVWSTVARRTRLQRDWTWRRAVCVQCLGPRTSLKHGGGVKPGRCMECWGKAQAKLLKEKRTHKEHLQERAGVLILG